MASIQINIPNWLDRIFTWPVLIYRKHKYGWPFRKIYLGEGKFTIVEPQDYYRFNVFNWCPEEKGPNTYAARVVGAPKKRTTVVSLHREIMNHPAGFLVDHKNGDGLDNRRANLRLATRSQNSCNSRKRANTTSQFIGVSFHKQRRRWVAVIKYKGGKKWLGRFVNEIEAAKAYDEAAKKYHGEFARLNFQE
ncbi:MAG: HNH endonuclease [Planctomycetota bacterium]